MQKRRTYSYKNYDYPLFFNYLNCKQCGASGHPEDQTKIGSCCPFTNGTCIGGANPHASTLEACANAGTCVGGTYHDRVGISKLLCESDDVNGNPGGTFLPMPGVFNTNRKGINYASCTVQPNSQCMGCCRDINNSCRSDSIPVLSCEQVCEFSDENAARHAELKRQSVAQFRRESRQRNTSREEDGVLRSRQEITSPVRKAEWCGVGLREQLRINFGITRLSDFIKFLEDADAGEGGCVQWKTIQRMHRQYWTPSNAVRKGAVDSASIRAILRTAFGIENVTDVIQFMMDANIDGNGGVTWEEFQSMFDLKWKPSNVHRTGSASRSDVRKLMRLAFGVTNHADVIAFMAAADVDEHGGVTWDELQTMFTNGWTP